VTHINRLINQIKLKKGIIPGIAQLVILLLCIVKLIINSIYFELSYFMMTAISALLSIISLLLWIKTPICQANKSCNNIEKMKGNFIRDLKCLSREQRHDYMNIFQIIYGYLQLKKADKAIEQIKKITNMTTSISKIYNISVLSISLLLEKKIKEADNQGVEIICNVTNYIEYEYRCIHNEVQIVEELTEIIDLFVNNMLNQPRDGKIFIDIFEYNDRLELIFKGDIEYALKVNIQRIHNDTIITDNETKLIFKYKQMENIIPNDTIYFSLLNNA
jgi:sensor kinase SpoOB-type protein